MTETIASLIAELGLDDTKFQSGVKGAKSTLGEMESSIRSGLGTVASIVGVATGAVVAFGTAAVKSFSDSETVATQLEAVLKSTNGVAGITKKQAIGLASAWQKQSRYSDEAVLGAENILLTFTNIGKDVFPDAIGTVLDMSTALGQDLKSSAIQLGKALQDPEEGLTALKRVGVNFTDAQKDVIKSMIASGRRADAMKLILKELKTEFGGSAKAAGDTLAGSLDKLKNKFDDLLESAGSRIAPVLESGISFVSDAVDKGGAALDTFSAQWGDFVNNVQKFDLKTALDSALNTGGNGYKVGWIQGVFQSLGMDEKSAATLVTSIKNAVDMAFDPKVFISALQNALGKVGDWLGSDGPGNLVNGLAGLVKSAGEWIANTGWPMVKAGFISIVSNISAFFQSEGWMRFVTGLGTMFNNAKNWLYTEGLQAFNSGIREIVIDAYKYLSGTGTSFFKGGAVAAISGMADWIRTQGPQIIINAINDMLVKVASDPVFTDVLSSVLPIAPYLKNLKNLQTSQPQTSTHRAGSRSRFSPFASGGQGSGPINMITGERQPELVSFDSAGNWAVRPMNRGRGGSNKPNVTIYVMDRDLESRLESILERELA